MNVQCWQLIYIVGVSAFACGLIVAGIVIEKIYVTKREKDSRVEFHQPPSWVVRAYNTYLTWCNVTVCKKCGLHAHEIDFSPTEECLRCGTRSTWYRKSSESKIGYWGISPGKWILNKSTKG